MLNPNTDKRSVEVKTLMYTYDYDPKSEVIRMVCDGGRYTKSVISWESWNQGDCAYIFSIWDVETVELADGKITPINDAWTYVMEVNKSGQLLWVADPDYCIEAHLQ